MLRKNITCARTHAHVHIHIHIKPHTDNSEEVITSTRNHRYISSRLIVSDENSRLISSEQGNTVGRSLTEEKVVLSLSCARLPRRCLAHNCERRFARVREGGGGAGRRSESRDSRSRLRIESYSVSRFSRRYSAE